jgi:type VI secretion system ImpA family protein
MATSKVNFINKSTQLGYYFFMAPPLSSPELSIPLTSAEWELLLAPLAQPSPVGNFLLYEGTYDKIKEARREDDTTLARHEWDTTLKKADWPQVRQLCFEALAYRSKDLQITVWLTEALLHLHGYQGLKTGLQFLIQLSQTYWHDLYPPLEETDEELELRISPLQWLNHDKFVLQLSVVPITAPTVGDIPAYTFRDREQALLLEPLPQPQKEAAISEGKPTLTKFSTSVTLTSNHFYVSLVADLQESIDAVEQLNQLLDEYCGQYAPSLGKLRQKLLDIQHVVNLILVEREPMSTVEEIVTTTPESMVPLHETPPDKPGQVMLIRNRSEAYQRLAEIAEYLSKVEPHSPTPYLLKRAISWGEMSLTDLLHEIVNDERDLAAIYTLLGIQKKS